MQLCVRKTEHFSGNAVVPGSKSQTVRALILATLACGKSRIGNILSSDDSTDAMRVCAQLGAHIHVDGNGCTLHSAGLPLQTSATAIHTGNSGITTRFILPLLGLRRDCRTPVVVDCGDQMRARPIRPLVDVLCRLGMTIDYPENEGALPLRISGALRGGSAEVDGITSQYTSALLLSLPCAPEDSILTVHDLHERPYVGMTLTWLRDLGISCHHEQTTTTDVFHIPGRQQYPVLDVSVAGDFSSASYPIAAAVLVGGEVTLQGLDMAESQGDKRLVEILRDMGADIVVTPGFMKIRGGCPLWGRRIDANDIPDLVPALAVIATQAAGTTDICNVRQARLKETDRIRSMTEGLSAMGARIEEHDDGLTVHRSRLHGAAVKGYGDHRTVMALALAGMLAEGTTTITDAESVAKTFPDFVPFMTALGARMERDAHILLMGFKHVGKSVIGKALAQKLGRPFYELDAVTESLHASRSGTHENCREIVDKRGEAYFRDLEAEALKNVLQQPVGVVALGGGTPLADSNRSLIHSHIPVHITAPANTVRSRVTAAGWPGVSRFDEIWRQRDPVYRVLAQITVDNTGSVEEAVAQIAGQLK